jgi:hypothetical protein
MQILASDTSEENTPLLIRTSRSRAPCGWPGREGGGAYLLPVVGHVRKKRGHVEHELIVLVRGVQGVGSRGVS